MVMALGVYQSDIKLIFCNDFWTRVPQKLYFSKGCRRYKKIDERWFMQRISYKCIIHVHAHLYACLCVWSWGVY